MNVSSNLHPCRLCLQKTATKVNIFRAFRGNFPKMLEMLTSIKIQENDHLPPFSCTNCALDVKSALVTRERIIKSHRALLENLRRKQKSIATVKTKRTSEVPSSARTESVNKTVKKKIVTESVAKPEEKKSVVNENIIKNAPEEKKSGVKEDKEVVKDVIEKCGTELLEISGANIEIEDDTSTTSDSNFICVKTEKSETVVVKSNSFEETETKLVKPEPESNKKEPQEINDEKTTENVKTKQVKSKFVCEICRATFSMRSMLTSHYNKHKQSKCPICGKFLRADNMKKHIIRHSDKPVNCKLCGALCKNTESLRCHIFYQHKCTPDNFVCEECGKKFRTKYKFHLHQKKEHTGLRNFKCDTCGKSFFTRANLNTHINMTHKKLRPHICEFCGTGYSSAYALKTHKRQHTNEKPFECNYCSECFRQRVSLRSHLKSKHGYEEMKQVFCKHCHKGFATAYALSIHERLHAAEKCVLCSQSFVGSEYLQNHLREVHNVQ